MYYCWNNHNKINTKFEQVDTVVNLADVQSTRQMSHQQDLLTGLTFGKKDANIKP